ncbi:MAG: hypothetical protein V3V17_07830 [Alphaproteobacteria bacterium]
MKRVIIAALFALALSTPTTVKAEEPVDPADEALRRLKEQDQAKYAYFTDILINTQWEFPTSSAHGGIYTYSFLENGDYVVTWKPGEGEPQITKGAWKFDNGICGSTLNKNSPGNFMIYLPDAHCCYQAAFVGTKLTLSAVVGVSTACGSKTLRASHR